MKQFLAATAAIVVIGLLSLPVVYFMDAGRPPAAVAHAAKAAIEAEPVAAAPSLLTDEERRRIIARSAPGAAGGNDAATAIVDTMAEISRGLRDALPEGEGEGAALVAAEAPASGRASMHRVMAVAVVAGEGADSAASLVGDNPGRKTNENRAEAESEAEDDAPMAVAALAPADAAGAPGVTAPVRYVMVGANLGFPSAAVDLGGFGGERGGLMRDYPTSFLWYYIV